MSGSLARRPRSLSLSKGHLKPLGDQPRPGGSSSCVPIGPVRRSLGTLLDGGVSERPKERASKAREGQPSEGSNPSATANVNAVPDRDGILHLSPARLPTPVP